MKKLLIIDDEYAIVDALVSLLEDEGFEVLSAANGREALQLMQNFKPDLVLCDVMMPVMGGKAFFEAFRHLPECQNTPVIFMSAVHAGVDVHDPHVRFLKKPFQLDALLDLLTKALAH